VAKEVFVVHNLTHEASTCTTSITAQFNISHNDNSIWKNKSTGYKLGFRVNDIFYVTKCIISVKTASPSITNIAPMELIPLDQPDIEEYFSETYKKEENLLVTKAIYPSFGDSPAPFDIRITSDHVMYSMMESTSWAVYFGDVSAKIFTVQSETKEGINTEISVIGRIPENPKIISTVVVSVQYEGKEISPPLRFTYTSNISTESNQTVVYSENRSTQATNDTDVLNCSSFLDQETNGEQISEVAISLLYSAFTMDSVGQVVMVAFSCV
jgi:hypothetical protein